MSLKEKMMDGMMGNMSKEEKMEMMDKMMEKFFADMTPDEKQKMMQDMMSKMMGSFIGSGENESDKDTKGGKSSMMDMMKMMMGGKSSMMDMMKMMMGGKSPMMGMMMGMDSDGKGEKPWDICQKMMSSITKSSEIASFATPEIRGLFEEWIQQIEEEFITFIKSSGTNNVEKLQEHFKLSKDSVIYFLTRLSQKGKIKFKIDSE